ncbi:MAG: hypothetical protein AB1762_05000 [Gemmatimonadota bacterium]
MQVCGDCSNGLLGGWSVMMADERGNAVGHRSIVLDCMLQNVGGNLFELRRKCSLLCGHEFSTSAVRGKALLDDIEELLNVAPREDFPAAMDAGGFQCIAPREPACIAIALDGMRRRIMFEEGDGSSDTAG